MRACCAIISLMMMGCGSSELTVLLELDPGVEGTVVWYRPIVREFSSEIPQVYPAQRVGDGSVRIPFPIDGKAFTLRIDACDEGDGCDVSRRMAVACSRALTVTEGETQAPIRLTLMPVPAPDPGGGP